MKKKPEYHSRAHGYTRPESFCAEMIFNGFSFEDINLTLQSNFKKSFHNEIESVDLDFGKNDGHHLMALEVNRDGLYDRLPEGVFHQTKGNSKTQQVTEMAEEHRRFKEEEKMARKFFQPIEQEFFRYSVMVEQEEVNYEFGLLNGQLRNEISDFWGLERGLPDDCKSRLEQIMPWAKMIKGDGEKTTRALSVILGKPVSLEVVNVQFCDVPMEERAKPSSELGIDSVIGSVFWEPSVQWKFRIEEIKKQDIEGFRPNGMHGKLLKHFEEIFIPLEIDIIFDYGVLTAEDVITDDVLGYSLVL
jgi:hypothetical protein